MENKRIEFNKWYEQEGLTYLFIDKPKGTDVLIRGDMHKLFRFIHQLDISYSSSESHANSRRGDFFQELKNVLDSGEPELKGLYFYDDRIRTIQRMDNLKYDKLEGPFFGDNTKLEIRHNEQYGGEYPANPLFSSRAGMIEKVLLTFQNFNKD